MAHSFRRSSYGGGNSSSYHPHHNSRGGYSAPSRHHRGAVAEDDDYYQYATSTHHHPHHHQQHRRSGGGDRYASDAGMRHDRGYGGGGHRSRAYYEEDDTPRAQPHHERASTGHRQQSQLQLQVLQQLQPPHVADAPEVPETPGTPPSIMHVRTKIPLSDFFPGQSLKGIVAYTPDTELPVDENEPIEAGRLPKKARTRSESATSTTSTTRRESTGEAVSALEQFECEDVARHKRKEEAYKTALCDAYRKNSECSYGKQCRFAHGEHELRLPPQPRGKAHPKYKTQLCDKFSVYGYCPYGPRCQFIHMMKKGLPLVEYEKKVRAGKISPTRECVEFIDEDDMESSYTRNNGRPFTVYQVDSRRYAKAGGGGGKEGRRRSYQDDYARGDRGGSSRRDNDYEPTERIRRHRSIEALNADAPRVTYEKIPTTPKRAPMRPKELSLIHEETEEHESPPTQPPSARHPGWVTHLLGGGAHQVAAPSPRTARNARGPPKMEQIEENEEGDYSEDYRYRKSEPRRSNRA